MNPLTQNWIRSGFEKSPFCPGCGHGVVQGSLLRALERLGIKKDNLLFISGIGCAGWIPNPQFKADTLHTLHGRALAFATGAKLSNPSLTTIVVSGDGDLASIGGNHLLHAARRNIDITVICANNQIYGMTGGQTAPTTPVHRQTTSDPAGNPFPPLDICAVALAAGAEYAARFPVTRPRKLVDAFCTAIETPGFTIVEAISPCTTHFPASEKCQTITEIYRYVDHCCTTEPHNETNTKSKHLNLLVGEFFK